jgi:hypothetical protein
MIEQSNNKYKNNNYCDVKKQKQRQEVSERKYSCCFSAVVCVRAAKKFLAAVAPRRSDESAEPMKKGRAKSCHAGFKTPGLPPMKLITYSELRMLHLQKIVFPPTVYCTYLHFVSTSD